jgi:NAD(P)-dependent dehydrogenase (short-subunit alcohol dehydrogenase family)
LGCTKTPRAAHSAVHASVNWWSVSPANDRYGMVTGPVMFTGSVYDAACSRSPETSWLPRANMWVIDLNLKSPFWLVQALLPALRRAGTADDPARIINIGSIAAIHVAQSPNYSYASSKAALHQLTRVLARELGPQHVTVNAVAPGPFPSQMMASTLDAIGDTIAAAAPLRRLGRDDDMAGIAVFLASRAGSYLTGTIIPVDGGIATTASGT